MPEKPPREHLGFLDGIRGFASLWVVLSHGLKMSGWGLPLLERGDLAVDVFMIMSGFLMAHHYLLRQHKEPWESPATWKTFYVRRFFRIAPLYYVVLAVSFATGPWFWHWRDSIASVFPSASTPAERYLDRSPANILTHITFIFGMIPSRSFSTSLPDWSIGLEMQFYLAFPFMMLLISRLRACWAAIILCAGGLLTQRLMPSGTFPMPSLLPLKLGLFVAGILLAMANDSKRSRPAEAGFTTVLALLVAASTHCSILVLMAVFVAAVLLYDRQTDPFRIRFPLTLAERVAGGRAANFMAETSYAAYLTHMMIMLPIAGLLAKLPAYRELPGGLRFLAVVIPVAVILYPLAWLIYQWIEKPGIALGKRFLGVAPNIPRPARA